MLIAGRRPEVFDVASPERPVKLDGARRSEELVGAFNRDGTRLVTTGVDATVWDTATGRPVTSLRGHRGPVTSVAYSPDGERIITGGEDRTVRLWDSETWLPAGVVRGFRDRVVKAELDPSARYLLVATRFDSPVVLNCTPCLGAGELARMGRRNATRALTAQERKDAGLTR